MKSDVQNFVKGLTNYFCGHSPLSFSTKRAATEFSIFM